MSNVQSVGENLAVFFEMRWVDVLQAALTPTIAIVAVYIAYQQWRTNQANLRERLFERRMEIFQTAEEAISAVLREGMQDEDSQWKLVEAGSKSRFLFGAEVQQFLEEVRKNIIDGNLAHKLQDHPQHDRSEQIDREAACFNAVCRQSSEIWEVFHPYLGFDRQR